MKQAPLLASDMVLWTIILVSRSDAADPLTCPRMPADNHPNSLPVDSIHVSFMLPQSKSSMDCYFPWSSKI
eukprot:6720872-Ditylum_brightwellii.AAC.1